MIIAARVVGLVLFGLAMIVLEFRAFSVPWSWTPAQGVLVLLALSILLGALWAWGRQGDFPFALDFPTNGRQQNIRNLLLWLVIAAALVAIFNIIRHH